MVEDHEIEKITVAPRITPKDLEDNIVERYAFTAYDACAGLGDEASEHLKCLTIAVLVLKNGFTVVGQNACASPENFNWDIGSRLAVENAKKKMWALMGYHLKQTLQEKSPGDLVGSGEAEQKLDKMLNELKDKDA